jgi:hypothetical protein
MASLRRSSSKRVACRSSIDRPASPGPTRAAGAHRRLGAPSFRTYAEGRGRASGQTGRLCAFRRVRLSSFPIFRSPGRPAPRPARKAASAAPRPQTGRRLVSPRAPSDCTEAGSNLPLLSLIVLARRGTWGSNRGVFGAGLRPKRSMKTTRGRDGAGFRLV